MAVSDHEIAAACLCALPGATAVRLRELWRDHDSPAAAYAAVIEGRARHRTWERWQSPNEWPRRAHPETVTALLQRRGTRVLLPDDADFPDTTGLDDPPALLFAEGSRFEVLHRRSISIVGTRAATPHGLADAYELAAICARRGIVVTSGLAIGIDAAAHRGAIDRDGLTIGVVATGLDVTYPRRHVELFARVRDHGLVLGEHAFGVGPEQWRFPVRNRIIAMLGHACVVVEATRSGGALSTAKRAADLNRPVLAMPGSRRNAAAMGTNELLRDGAIALLEPNDLLLALGDDRIGGEQWATPVPIDNPELQRVLDAFGGESATPDQLVGASGLSPQRVNVALRELEIAGRLERRYGKFWPR